jgi:hypothetical protein
MDVLVHCADDVGESPVWDDRHDCLRWVDLLAGIVRSVTPSGVLTQELAGCAVGAIGLTDTDDLVAAVRAGFARISPAGLRMLADVEADAPHRRMNDGKCDPWGRLRRRHDARGRYRCVTHPARASARSHTDFCPRTPTAVAVPAPELVCERAVDAGGRRPAPMSSPDILAVCLMIEKPVRST